MNQLIVHVARWKLRLYAWARASLLNHNYRLYRVWQKRRLCLKTLFATPSLLRASGYELRVAILATEWQLIRISPKTKDGHVQQFCSTHTIHH